MWLVSYRGEGKTGVDNIGAFEDDGKPRTPHPLLLDPARDARALHIPRGFALVGDDLYIASAWRSDSHVARYRRHGDTFQFAEVVMTTADLPAMVHPFDVQLGDDGRVYVSSQDTNTVVALVTGTRQPAPVVAALRSSFPDGHFLTGTLVASSRGGLPAVSGAVPVDVPSPLGLELVLDKKGGPKHSVRGIAVHRQHIYVADEAGDAVKVFELESGSLVARVEGRALRSPVHLRVHGDVLYIGSTGRGSILAVDLPAEPPQGKLKARVVVDGKLHEPSGFDIGPEGDLYVAEREKRRLRRFSLEGKKQGAFLKDLPDVPEFVLYVPSGSL